MQRRKKVETYAEDDAWLQPVGPPTGQTVQSAPQAAAVAAVVSAAGTGARALQPHPAAPHHGAAPASLEADIIEGPDFVQPPPLPRIITSLSNLPAAAASGSPALGSSPFQDQAWKSHARRLLRSRMLPLAPRSRPAPAPSRSTTAQSTATTLRRWEACLAHWRAPSSPHRRSIPRAALPLQLQRTSFRRPGSRRSPRAKHPLPCGRLAACCWHTTRQRRCRGPPRPAAMRSPRRRPCCCRR